MCRWRRADDPDAAVVRAALAVLAEEQGRVLRERALARLADRPGLAWAKIVRGLYVVALDGADIGQVRATRGRRRVRWAALPPGWSAPYRLCPTIEGAAMILRGRRVARSRDDHHSRPPAAF
ncbi:hypothetical protein FRACA_620022 [Frankia canadensis]|uniref:Uncharacterized protein n=1 Tax=Frankia canadensis TaxID=1836972 RepID=A0A2I2KZT2_9ACTN|nr:hypothetical protein [Frankia canadensis]SNQ51173.1 hypothetical protein FRACA_620022 [Frankia canadensis]SOU58463.1 hypothetical protein FRACA_620022 [Frankia canadensis]